MKNIKRSVFLNIRFAHFTVWGGNPKIIVDLAEPDLSPILFFVEVQTIAATDTF